MRGIPSRDLIYWLAGGPTDVQEFKCWFPGGSSAPVLTKDHLDLPLTSERVWRALREAEAALGGSTKSEAAASAER